MSRRLIVALLIVAVAYAVEDMRCGEDSRGNPIPKGTPGKTLLSFSNDLAPSAKFRMCHNGPKVGCDGNDFIDCAALNVTWHPERIPMGAAAEVSVDDQVQTIEVALYDKIGQFNVSSTCYITKAATGWPTETLVMNNKWWDTLQHSCN